MDKNLQTTASVGALWTPPKVLRTLDDFATFFNTDKASHSHDYCRVYEPLFAPLRSEPISLVELGIAQGASLQTWAYYFNHPERAIIGIDNDPQQQGRRLDPEKRQGVFTFCCDQTEMPLPQFVLDEVMDDGLDIIIDDASHHSSKTIASFETWFPLLKPGGLYCVEDIVTSYDQLTGEDEANRDPDLPPQLGGLQTAMQFFKRLADEVNRHALAPEFLLGYPVEWVLFHKDLVVIRKS